MEYMTTDDEMTRYHRERDVPVPLQKKLELLRHFTEYMDDFLTEGDLSIFFNSLCIIFYCGTLIFFFKKHFIFLHEARSWLEYFTSQKCKNNNGNVT